MSEWFVNLGPSELLATWLVASFLLYTLASQLAWQYRYPGRDDGLGRLIDSLRDQPFIPWVEEGIRFIYYLGIPFLAAISGLLGADLLGISSAEWVESPIAQGFLKKDGTTELTQVWARGLGLAAATALVTGGIWLAGRAISRRIDLMPMTPGIPGTIWQRLLRVLYDQTHWAFYRSGPILWLSEPYEGVFVGLALILLEAGLDPAARWALKDPETASPLLTRLSLAWISAFLFLATRNLWLTAAAHLVLISLWGGKRSDGYLFLTE